MPERLNQLNAPPSTKPDNRVAHADLDDLWGNPYVYEKIDPERYTLYSLGRDGRPGGVGPDTDLTGAGIHEARMSLAAFLSEPGAGGLWMSALTSTVFFGLTVVMSATRPEAAEADRSKRARLASDALAVAALVLVAVVVGYAMALHHAIQHTH